jgi:DNA-binding protein H-NS
MKQLNDDTDTPAVDETLFIEKIHLYSAVDEQQTFVQGFFDDSKDIAKTIRQTIQQKKKDEIKAAKLVLKEQTKASNKSEKKPRQKKDKTDQPDVAETDDQKKPRGRKPKAKVLSSDDAFVNEMVQLANGQDQIPSPTPAAATTPVKSKKEKEVKEKVVKEPKEKVVKEKVVKEKVVKEPKEKVVKEKVVKEPKEKAPTPSPQTNDQTPVSILELNGKQFLIDDLYNVYNFESHEKIGTFNPNNKTIS